MPISVVTGATGGSGLWIARGLAQAGHHVVLVGRDQARATLSQQGIANAVPSASTEFVLADLSLLPSTRALGKGIPARHPQIAVIVNNAGIFDTSRIITVERHEHVLATGHGRRA